jgi:periplasmic divalent cation tolerance protein
MSEGYLVVLCTCPDRETALHIAETLVDRRQAACVNVLPGITSVYEWEGTRQCEQEVLVIIKTREEAFAAVEETIRTLHPYELPEIVAIPLVKGFAPYLDWIHRTVQPT